MFHIRLLVFVLLLCLAGTNSAWAQGPAAKGDTTARKNRPAPAREYGYRLSAQPDSFYFDFTNGLLLTHTDDRARKLAGWFHEPWESFTPTQKERFIKIVKEKARRGLPARPYFEDLASVFVGASVFLKMPAARMDKLLTVTEQVLQAYPNDYGKQLQFFRSVALFGFRYALHERPYNGYYCEVKSDDYDFDFVGPAGNPNPSEAAPVADINWDAIAATPAANTPAPADPFAEASITGVASPIPPEPTDPAIAGPVIRVKKANIRFKNSFDEAEIENTDGVFLINEQVWAGTGGRFSWSVLDPVLKEKMYADLNKYQFKPGTPYFAAHHANLTYSEGVNGQVLGFLQYKYEDTRRTEKRNYPSFISYESKYEWKGLPQGLSIVGGIGIDGLKRHTGSYSQGRSYYQLRKGSELVAKGWSPRFDITDSLIQSPQARATLYFSGDSLVRPGLRFTYQVSRNRLLLFRENGLFSNTPMPDSYHEVSIKADVVEVPLDSNSIIINTYRGKGEVPAIFESKDYYSKDLMTMLRGEHKFEPVLVLASHSLRAGSRVFYAGDVWADYNKYPRMYDDLCHNLSAYGFIDWNPVTKQMVLTDQTLHFAESARKKKDYDYMGMYSYVPKGVNAILNKKSKDLDIYGLEKFYLSDSLNVFITPKNEHITLNKGRDIKFDGKINAGAFLTSGREFKFSYSEFKVDLTNIDSINIDTEKDQGLDKKEGQVKLEGKRHSDEDTTNQVTSGTLYINKPDNKSGNRQEKQYPIIDIGSYSYVYFDKAAVLNRAYNQNVYFKVPPFKMDSTSSGDLSNISFEGTFHSDNIFPVIKEVLSVQADKSLGFQHKVPATGYKLYNGQGTFYGDITLNNKGIRGKGEIHYLSSVIKSDDFVFYQDSVVAVGQTLTMNRTTNPNVPFPDVKGKNFKVRWLPKQDSLVLISGRTGGAFKMYDSTTTLQGRLVVTSKGALGQGVVKRQGSTVISKDFAFQDQSFGGRNAVFRIETEDPSKPAVAFQNVQFKYDLTGRKAFFNRESEGVSKNTFPYINYITSIPSATWDFDQQIISMSKPDSIDINESYFLSTAKEQEGLKFSGTQAIYDIKAQTLNIGGVEKINVADAIVMPDSGKVAIKEGGAMQQLVNARLQMDTVKMYHSLKNGTVTVNGKNNFEGQATYLYVNADGDTLNIDFDHFDMPAASVKNTKGKVKATMSGGEVVEERPLQIAPGVLFKGKVTMIANKENLLFDGAIAMSLKSADAANTWIAYKSNGDSKDFKVDLANAKDPSGKKIATGIFIESSSGRLYTNFMAAPRDVRDKPLFLPGNKLSINPETKDFRVGDGKKMDGKDKAGAVYTYNDSTRITSVEGKLNFFNDDKNVRVTSAGSGSGKATDESAEFTFNSLMRIELPLPPPAAAAMEKQVAETAKNLSLPDANDDQVALLQRIADYAGAGKPADDYAAKSQTTRQPLSVAVPSLGKGIVLSDVQLKWSDKEGAFYSVGPIGLANINKTEVNSKVNGVIEIKKTMNGDVLTIALQVSPGTWYYFSYDDQKRFSTLGSSLEFNNAIAAKRGGTPGSLVTATADAQEKLEFLQRFHRTYLNTEYVDKDEPAPQPDAPAGDQPAGETPAQQPAADDPFGDFGGKKEDKKPDAKEGDRPADGAAPADGAVPADAGAPVDAGAPAGDAPAEGKKDKKDKKKKGKKEEAAPEKTEVPPADPLNDLGLPSEPAKPAETPAEKPAEESPKKKKKGDDKPAEETKPAETPAETPAATPAETPAEQPKPAETPAEQPKPADTPPAEQPKPADPPKEDGF